LVVKQEIDVEVMTRVMPATLPNGLIAHVEVTPLGTDEDVAFSVPEWDQVTQAVQGITSSVMAAIQEAKPRKAVVEFGIEVGLDSGKLTAILVKGTGKANLKISLEWGGE
jgi:hypothetical protein